MFGDSGGLPEIKIQRSLAVRKVDAFPGSGCHGREDGEGRANVQGVIVLDNGHYMPEEATLIVAKLLEFWSHRRVPEPIPRAQERGPKGTTFRSLRRRT
jgi:hypothetical protein